MVKALYQGIQKKKSISQTSILPTDSFYVLVIFQASSHSEWWVYFSTWKHPCRLLCLHYFADRCRAPSGCSAMEYKCSTGNIVTHNTPACRHWCYDLLLLHRRCLETTVVWGYAIVYNLKHPNKQKHPFQMLADCLELKYSASRYYLTTSYKKKILIFTKFTFIKQGDGFLKFVKHLFVPRINSWIYVQGSHFWR